MSSGRYKALDSSNKDGGTLSLSDNSSHCFNCKTSPHYRKTQAVHLEYTGFAIWKDRIKGNEIVHLKRANQRKGGGDGRDYECDQILGSRRFSNVQISILDHHVILSTTTA